jgi:hypothetical protein
MMMGMTGIIIHLLRHLRIGGTRISGIGIGRMPRLLRVSRSDALRVLRIEVRPTFGAWGASYLGTRYGVPNGSPRRKVQDVY